MHTHDDIMHVSIQKAEKEREIMYLAYSCISRDYSMAS